MENYPNHPLKHEKNMRTMLEAARKAYGGRDMLRVRTREKTVRGIGIEEFLEKMNALGNALLGLGLADAHIRCV